MIDTARTALFGLPRRLLVAAALVSAAMVPVGLLVAALGVLVLKVSGGAASDTSLVIAVTGFLVADFWGGGIVAALTKVDARRVAVAWTIARAGVLIILALLLHRLVALVPIQLALSFPAAFAGARMSHKQAALRRAIEAERAAQQAPAEVQVG